MDPSIGTLYSNLCTAAMGFKFWGSRLCAMDMYGSEPNTGLAIVLWIPFSRSISLLAPRKTDVTPFSTLPAPYAKIPSANSAASVAAFSMRARVLTSCRGASIAGRREAGASSITSSTVGPALDEDCLPFLK